MNRIYITNKPNAWFDKDNAECFDDETYWDGNNHISIWNNSQFIRSTLYYTASKNWVLHTHSAYQGSRDSFEIIDLESVTIFFIKNNYVIEDLQADVKSLLLPLLKEMEV